MSEAHLRAMPAVRRGPSEAHARGRGAGRPERKVTLPRAGPREVGRVLFVHGRMFCSAGCISLCVPVPSGAVSFFLRKEKRNYIRKKDLHIIRSTTHVIPNENKFPSTPKTKQHLEEPYPTTTRSTTSGKKRVIYSISSLRMRNGALVTLVFTLYRLRASCMWRAEE